MVSKLKTRADLQNARAQCKAALGKQRKRIFVCTGTGCAASGSLSVYERLAALMKENTIDCAVEPRGSEHAPHSAEFCVAKPLSSTRSAEPLPRVRRITL
jgi:hypothetical protein